MDQQQFVSELAALRPSSTFLTLKGYRNEAAEIADYNLAFHISYRSALEKSKAILQGLVLSNDLERQAQSELIMSFDKSLQNIEQTTIEDIEDGYQRFFDEENNYIKGVKLHVATHTLHLYGLVVHKRVLMPGNYKPTNRRPLTIAKDKLRYLTPVGKFRQFRILPSQVDYIRIEKLSLLPPSYETY
jgi:hypothetical protein